MQKKPFLLLEILIALFILSLCLVPLIQAPIQAYRKEKASLEQIERERLAEWSFSEIKEKLFRHEIPWNKLPSTEKKGLQASAITGPFPLPPAEIELPGFPPKTLKRSFILHCRKGGEKEGLNGEIYKLLEVELLFTPALSKKESYRYRLLVKKTDY